MVVAPTVAVVLTFMAADLRLQWLIVGLGRPAAQTLVVEHFTDERAASIRDLFKTARAAAPFPARTDEVAIAFRKLGHLRAVEAVPVLLDHLAFDPYGGGALRPHPFTLETDVPTVYALGQVGVPALGPLAERVATGDEQATQWAAVVARRVLGRELGKAYFKSKAAAEPDRGRAARLERQVAATEAVGYMYLGDLPGERPPSE